MISKLNSEFGIAGAVSILEGINGMPKIVLVHESGAQAEVYLHGAHITSWKNAAGEDLFFLSRESWFGADKPIRGGIPVIFPQFGGQGPLPGHGIARNREWRLASTGVSESGTVLVELVLAESAETLEIWPHRFELSLTVLLDQKSLTVEPRVANTDDDAYNFQFALHTYFAVGDISRVSVQGLEGVSYIDSLRDRAVEVENRPEIRFAEETDRIYTATPDTLRIIDESVGRTFVIEKTNMPDVVVWNPWIDKSKRMPDYGDDEYLRMVCVETGTIETRPSLRAGECWRGSTKFSV